MNDHCSAERLGASHEYGDLREVIVGVSDGVVIPKLTGEMRDELKTLTNQSVEFWLEGQGKALKDYDPDMNAELEEQVEGLVRILELRGVTVHRPRQLTKEEERYPGLGTPGGSLLFMRDPIVVLRNYVIELAMRFPFRRRQRFTIRDILENRVGETNAIHVAMPEPVPQNPEQGFGPSAFLEGGDVLLNGDEIYVGVSGHASNARGADWLQKLIGRDAKVETVEIIEGYIHLDCVLSLPRPGLALACLDALPNGLPVSLQDWEIINVTLDEAKRLGCNGMVLSQETYIMDKSHDRIAEQLDKKGVEVIAIPYDLPAKFGGGMRCSHHPLWREF